jgi:hypothetical protein
MDKDVGELDPEERRSDQLPTAAQPAGDETMRRS